MSKLYDEGIRNFVTAETIEGIKKEILECVDTEGMGYEKTVLYKYEPPEKPESEDLSPVFSKGCHFNCKGLKITVAGTAGKFGTTTAALNLAHFLASLGARVSYIEANQNGHVALLSSFNKEIIVNDYFMEHKGVRYYSIRMKYDFTAFHFNILDVGVLSPEYLEIFKKSDIKILCATSKPYELTGLTRALKLVGDTEMNCIFSFTPDRSRKYLREIAKGYDRKIYFTYYSPDLFDGNANRVI